MKMILVVGSAFALSGCGLGMLTPSRTFNTSDSFVLPSAGTNFVEVASEVGRSLKYNISGVDRSNNAVTLSDNSGPGSSAITGKLQTISFTVQLRPDGRTVDTQALATGNMGSVSQDKIEKRMDAIKKALRTRF